MTTTVSRNSAETRYEITLDGELAGFSQFSMHGDVITFIHTEIESAFEGRGLATELIREALDDVRARGQRAVARCPFVHAFIDKHADYQDLLAD